MNEILTLLETPQSLVTTLVEGPSIVTALSVGQGPAGPAGISGSSGGYQQDNFVITEGDLAAKQIALSLPPLEPAKVILVIFTGMEQRSGVDFLVTGSILSWDALALDLLLEVGMSVSVRYFV